MRTRFLSCSLVAGLAALIASSLDAATLYVDADLTTGSNDGTSWENAYRGPQSLKTAMDAAVAGDAVWVAAGTYKASPSTRTVSHVLKNNVKVYGGFAGGESDLAQRDPVANLTRISGDLTGNDNPAVASTYSDNSYHLITCQTGTLGLVDGFELRGGNANGASASNLDKGGAIICLASQSHTFQSCRFIDNRCTFGGGAGYLHSSSPKFLDCLFENNQGGSFGGAFDSANTTQPVFERCIFRGNKAARAGALEFFGGSQPKVTNCLFHNNQATGSGGGGAIWLGSSSSGTFRNITVTANNASVVGGGVYNTGGSSTFINCISFGNTGPGTIADNGIKSQGGTSTITYSDVQGLTTGTGNINLDPQFENAAGGDYRLQVTSPCIDKGNNGAVPVGTTTDLDRLARFVDIASAPDGGSGSAPIVDMGSYEEQEVVVPCPADLDGSGVVDATDLALVLGGWSGASGDVDGNGLTDAQDIAILLGAWGGCP
ncbi:MAG: hypothetical protein JNL80_15605 [Phycisphaerae bacterium]|nr:hypothetical protein [Phycisphaerae bacterium]